MKFFKKKDKIQQPALSDEQLEIFSSHMENNGEDRSTVGPFDMSLKGRVIRYAKQHKATAIFFVVGLISLLSILILLIVYSATTRTRAGSKDDFIIRMEQSKLTFKYEEIMINDTVYLDMNKISEIYGIQISGDSSSRKFTLPNIQYVRFENESSVAILDGNYIEMNSKAIINGDKCLVPLNFISKIMQGGLTFDIDYEKNIIKINRIKIGIGDKNEPVYEPLSFTVPSEFEQTNLAYEAFGINAVENLIYLDPSSNEYQILVNHQNPLSEKFEPNDLTELDCDTNPVNPSSYYSLRTVPAKALSLMMEAMKNASIDGIQVSSSYRSYERQVYLLEYYTESKMSTEKLSYEDAQKEVLKTLAIPGHSEHQTGLSVDFVQGTKSLTTNFENSSAFEWLSQNAHKFGFILRYPSDKTDLTGYDYEPWHYRFVGRTVASRIYEANICYEEYVALTN